MLRMLFSCSHTAVGKKEVRAHRRGKGFCSCKVLLLLTPKGEWVLKHVGLWDVCVRMYEGYSPACERRGREIEGEINRDAIAADFQQAARLDSKGCLIKAVKNYTF